MRLRAVDLCAGIGGFRLAFERVFDLETVFVSESDKNAAITYGSNFPGSDIWGDIMCVEPSSVPSFDICFAGIPCQPFSVAGHRRGLMDDRANVFYGVMRICDHHMPSVILIENVKGLVGHDGGKTFLRMMDRLRDMGYVPHCEVLNSRDFGVPQNRERVYIVAFRGDMDMGGFAFPEPVYSFSCISDILEETPVPSRYYLSQRYLDTLKRHREKHESKGNGFGYIIRSPDDVAGALSCGGMGLERNLISDDRSDLPEHANDEYIRKLTPRECARLQGFPETFVLPVADTHLYRQFGNAVTVPVVQSIAESVKAVI